MNTTKIQRRLSLAVLILLLFSLFIVPAGASPSHEGVPPLNKVSNEVLEALSQPGSTTQFIVFLEAQADLSAAYKIEDQDARGWYVFNTLKEAAARTQASVIAQLAAAGAPYQSFWVANMIASEGGYDLVVALAARPDVRRIESNQVIDGVNEIETPENTDEGDATDVIESGITQANAPSLWNLGYTGQGIVIGNQDTGVRWTHATLRTHYRGWGGSVAASDHNYNWWDAIHAQITTGDGGTGSPATNPCGRNTQAPCDDQGHGTHTTGTVVGSDAGAGIGTGTNQVGVAPDAQWIACRNMDSGNGRASTYTECFQFFIAPTDVNGQNPDPSKRPHVMNNSWGCPESGELCARTVLQTITENAQAAGIMVVASAGNDGSACFTVQDPPGIYDAAFTVGSFTSANALSGFSSRGWVTSDGSGRMKPDISARGQSVRSAYRTSDTTYATLSGTSMASPHVVGSVALLWSAAPNLVRDIPRTKWLLTRSANPNVTVPNNAAGCGGIGSIPNNHFGWGRVDVTAAYNLESTLYQTISFDPLADKTYGEPDFSVSATASSGLPVSFTANGSCTISDSTIHITDVGSCTITASQPGLDLYGIAANSEKPWYPAPSVSQTFSIHYDFSGFFQPVDSYPTWNSLKAGAAVPIKFSLSGDQGLNIFAPGYPQSQQVACDTGTGVDVVEETVTAGQSQLAYNAETDQYTYVWKSSKAWAGTCRQFIIQFADGTIQYINFLLR